MHGEDTGVDSSEAVRQACEFFGLPSLRAIARAFYSGELTRDRIAAFASVNVRSPATLSAATLAATKLSRLVREALVRGAPPRVALVGGKFSDDEFAATVAEHLVRERPGVEIVEPTYGPAIGALLLAYREAGIAGVEIAS